MSKKDKSVKTNAVRLLEHDGINFRQLSYVVDENDLSAEHLAETASLDIVKVYKTLVLKGEKVGYFVCVVCGNREVNLKVAAQAIGAKKVEMIPMKDLLSVTGYIRGGCSPIGMKKQFPTLIDSDALALDEIYVSAGIRGQQIVIDPRDLAQYLDAKMVDNLSVGK